MISIITEGVSKDVMEVLENQGLPIQKNLAIDLPPLPDDITAVDDQTLMGLSSKYMQYYNFILTQVACAEIAVLEAKSKHDTAEAKAMLTHTTGKTTEKSVMLKAQVLTLPEMVELSNNLLTAEAYHKLLKTSLENLERCYQLTSRELTRRTAKMRGF